MICQGRPILLAIIFFASQAALASSAAQDCEHYLQPTTEAKLSEPAQAYIRLIALALKTHVLNLSDEGGFKRLLKSDGPYNPFSREATEPVEVALAQAIEAKLSSLQSEWSIVEDKMRELESQQQSSDAEQDTAEDEASWMIGLQDPLWLPSGVGISGTVAWLVTHGRVFMSSFDDSSNVQVYEIDVEKGVIAPRALTTKVNVNGVIYPMQWVTVRGRSYLGIRSKSNKAFDILELNLDMQSLDHFQSIPIDRQHTDVVLIEDAGRLLVLTIMVDDDKDPKQTPLKVFELNPANKDVIHHTVATSTNKLYQFLRVVKWNGKLIIAGSGESEFRFFEFDPSSNKVSSFKEDVKGESFRLPVNLYEHEGRLFAITATQDGKLHVFEFSTPFGAILRHEVIDVGPSNYSPSVYLKQGRMLLAYGNKDNDLITLEFDLKTNELSEISRAHLIAFAASMVWTEYKDRIFIGVNTTQNGLFSLVELNETNKQLHVLSTFSIGVSLLVRSALFTSDSSQDPALVVPMTKGFYLFRPIQKIGR